MRALLMVGLIEVMGACTHVAGVVERSNGRPLTTAELSIGRPTDIVMYGAHPVDGQGHFDFYIGPADETNLYVYDRGGDVAATIRQIRPDEINDHMMIKVDPSNIEMDPSLRAIP